MSTSDITAPQRVLLTGPSRGIGRALALAFARPEYRLALLGRPSPEMESVAAECEQRAGEVTVAHADVTDAQATTSAVASVVDQFEGIDVLVNNAGVGRYAPFLELTSEDWEEMLLVNVAGPANVIRAVLPTMVEQGDGHIVNMGSIRGIETIPLTTGYSASKFAVVGFTQALRQELKGTGVRVSVIAPGGVKTEFAQIPVSDKSDDFLEPDIVAAAVVDMVEFRSRAWIRDLTIMQLD